MDHLELKFLNDNNYIAENDSNHETKYDNMKLIHPDIIVYTLCST